MLEERFIELMEIERSFLIVDHIKGCDVLKGLLIITKYLPTMGIEAAGHDQVFSVSVEEIVSSGITEEDTLALNDLGWFIEYDVLAHFV